MAVLTAFSRYDVDDFDLNQFYENFDAKLRDNNVFNPWEDNYTVWTPEVAIELLGRGFRYNGRGEMVHGTVEGFAEWYYDDFVADWVELYNIHNIREVSSQAVFDASQTNKTSDDYALLAQMLAGNDRFRLSADGDKARGYDGNDRMFGKAGNDILRGDNGNDRLRGGGDDDRLLGGNDNDRLFGDAGNDDLRGGNGNDILRGGPGRDRLLGGDGEDIFRFRTGDETDVIVDMDARGAVHDVIDLSGLASVRGWKDLTNNHMFRDGDHVVIDGGDGDMIVIRNTTLSSLDKGDFIF